MLRECPDVEYHYVNEETGELGMPSRCRRSTCLFCLRRSAGRIHRAVALARPSTMVNLTGLSGDWQTDRAAVNRLVTYLRTRDGLSFAMAWAIERNPEHTGYHAHGWSWGDRLRASALAGRCEQVGLGRPKLKPVTNQRNFAYVIKTALHNQDSLDDHRRLNGREVIHARGFWRDPASGTLLTKQKALLRADGFRRSTG